MLSLSLLLVFPVLLICILKPKTQETDGLFISFAADTRSGFTSHLEASFTRHGIVPFLDHKIERGDEIFPALLRAIKLSKISIIVFSKYYATSKWCLDELAKIMECERNREQVVIPVFYRIKPSEVREQSGTYEAAFAEHERCYQRRGVRQWRNTMKDAANLSGWDISSYGGSESQLVDEITSVVKKKIETIRQHNRRERRQGLFGLVYFLLILSV
ncbi:hypothetical protein K1719_017377 [Acacia pycnantha]|nr:hypothetical protein K1719_017377 [Acacia pycnantha]